LADPFSDAWARSIYEKHREFDAMRLFFAPMMIGMLALAGASPAAAQSKTGSGQGTSVGMSATRDAATERSSYTHHAQDEVQIWQQKLHDFDAKMRVNATKAEASASKDLDSAWAETQTASSRLETAGEKDWDSAKASYKTASDRLASAWQKVGSKDK
jgi:hypothetical protein